MYIPTTPPPPHKMYIHIQEHGDLPGESWCSCCLYRRQVHHLIPFIKCHHKRLPFSCRSSVCLGGSLEAVPEPPCSDSYKFPSRFQLQIIHSHFPFFVCKPKFLFSLNTSCPSLVLSLSCLHSVFSKETKLVQSHCLAGSFSVPQLRCNLLASFNQCWQGSSG